MKRRQKVKLEAVMVVGECARIIVARFAVEG